VAAMASAASESLFNMDVFIACFVPWLPLALRSLP
jgi:hypothetical protein